MRHFLVCASVSLFTSTSLYSAIGVAEQLGKMSVTIVASGSDATRSEGEWSKGTFSYQAAFTATLQSDGEPSDLNMYDPNYAENVMAMAAANMAKVQAALKGQFSDEEEPEPDYRYLLFMGQMDCPTTLIIEVNEKLEGEYADVGGMQPYTVTFTAQSNGTDPERDMLCVTSNSVLDIKDNTLYRSTLGFPEVAGHYISHEANRGNLQDNPESRHNALPQLVSDYVFETLRVAPASGHKKTTLTPTTPVLTRSGPFGAYQGSVDVDITWSFEIAK